MKNRARLVLALFLVNQLALGSFVGGGGGSSSSSGGTGDLVGPSSATDGAIARFDTTTGKLLKDSGILLGTLSSNRIITGPVSASTATKFELKGGDKSTAGVGGSLVLRGGAANGANERGDVLIGGTANSTGNRGTFGSETDGVGEWGYCYGLSQYCRPRAIYAKTSFELRDSGGASSGFNFFQDGTDSQIRMYRSTGSHGLRITNNGDGLLTFLNEAADTTFFQINKGNLILGSTSANVVRFNNATQSTVGGAGGASALPATPSGYKEENINGTAVVIPYYPKS